MTHKKVEVILNIFSNNSLYDWVDCFTAQVKVDGNVMIDGGGLQDVYKIVQFHFHWGSDSTRGAEHTINGQTYPLAVSNNQVILFTPRI